MDKPDVDFIEGLSPAISIDQKSASRNPRSTVGTITEVYDYLRLLYARIGVPHCPERRRGDHPPDAPADRRPHPRAARGHPVPGAGARSCAAARAPTSTLLADLATQGFARARIDGEVHELTDKVDLARYEQHTIEVVVDRLVLRDGIERRLTDSLETALRLADGVAEVAARAAARRAPTTASRRDAHLHPAPGLPERRHGPSRSSPRATSRSTRPTAPATHCDGLGTRFEVDPELVVPEPRPLARRGRHRTVGRRAHASTSSRLRRVGAPRSSASTSTRRGRKLTKKQQKRPAVRHRARPSVSRSSYKNRYGRSPLLPAPSTRASIPYLQRRHTEAESRHASASRSRATCARCRAPPAAAPASSRCTLGGHHRRPQHRRALRAVDRRGGQGRSPGSSCPSATA